MATASNTSRPKGFTCTICGKNFEDQLTLDAHKKMDHIQAEPPSGVG